MRAMQAVLSTTPSDPTGHVPLAVSVVGVVLLAVIAIIALLALTGYLAARRRDESQRAVTDERIRAANSALAAAHAADQGWDPAVLRTAALDAARGLGIADPSAVGLSLVSVDDRPGVEDDRASFVVADGERTHEIVLGRSAGGEWRAV
jgi:type II secretory pathway pseudopilin PulG